MSSEYLCDIVMPDPEPEPMESPAPASLQRPKPAQEEGSPPSPCPSGPSLARPGDKAEEEIDYDPVPEPVKRAKIPQEDIFSDMLKPGLKPGKVKSILDPEVLEGPPPIKPKQTRKKRGPASAEQLERLARGRAKAQKIKKEIGDSYCR